MRELAAPGSPYSGKGNKAVLLEKLRRLRVVKNGGPSPQRIRGAQHARQEISPAKRSRRGSTVERLGDCRMALWWQGRRAETIRVLMWELMLPAEQRTAVPVAMRGGRVAVGVVGEIGDGGYMCQTVHGIEAHRELGVVCPYLVRLEREHARQRSRNHQCGGGANCLGAS